MDAQAKQFAAATGNKVVVSYGGSNALAKQIEAGAPAECSSPPISIGWTTSTSAACSRRVRESISFETRSC